MPTSELKFLIKSRQSDTFLFGNRSFTSNRSSARQFSSSEMAASHIYNWFGEIVDAYGQSQNYQIRPVLK